MTSILSTGHEEQCVNYGDSCTIVSWSWTKDCCVICLRQKKKLLQKNNLYHGVLLLLHFSSFDI